MTDSEIEDSQCSWSEIIGNFPSLKGNKFNKNLILLSLREMTGLTTKEIRNALKKYKVIYKSLVDTLRK